MNTAPGLARIVADDYHRVFKRPWEIPKVLITNSAMMVAAWFLLPPHAHALMFSLNGPLAFPIILGSWMLADTPATNVMGANPAAGLSALQDQSAYGRRLAARCIVLGSLIGVPCAIVALFVGIGSYPWSDIVWACALIAILPVGVLPVSAWLGILFPYRPRSLQWRWQHRRDWRTQLRWVALVFAPFVYVPWIGSMIVAPGVALGNSMRLPGQRLTPVQFGISVAVACMMAVGRGRDRHLGVASTSDRADRSTGGLSVQCGSWLIRSAPVAEASVGVTVGQPVLGLSALFGGRQVMTR